MLIAFRRQLDVCRQAGGFLLGLALFQILLLLCLIGCGPGICVLIACGQHQRNAILCRCGRHLPVGIGSLRFQLDGAILIGRGKGRRRFPGKGQIGVYQYKPRIVGVKGVAGAAVAGSFKAPGPGKQSVCFGQQPEDAPGHQGHDGSTDQDQERPVAGQTQTLAAHVLLAGHTGLYSFFAGWFHGALQLLWQNLQRAAPHRYSVYYTPLCILCKRRKCKISMTVLVSSLTRSVRSRCSRPPFPK